MSNFKGVITEISEIKSGTSNDKEWASLDFEVTESNPQNEKYPQIGLFSYFKNGDYVKYAKDFNDNFKIGDEVDVDYNLKCIKYTKDNEERKFYKTECWKVQKVEANNTVVVGAETVSPTNNEEDDLPF